MLFTLLLVAVTGLVLTVTRRCFHECPSDRLAVANHVRRADKTIGTRDKQAVNVTSSVVSPVDVIDALGKIDLNSVAIKSWRDCHNPLTILRVLFLARTKREIDFRVGEIVRTTSLSHGWWFILNRIANFMFGDRRYSVLQRKNVVGSHIADILHSDFKSAKIQLAMQSIARHRIKQCWWAVVHHDRPVLGLESPFCLQISPDRYTEITYTSYSNKAREKQFELSSSTPRLPISPQGVLLVLFGFLGGLFGFTALFACLFLGSTWREVAGSAALILCSIVVFHFGLFCLLK